MLFLVVLRHGDDVRRVEMDVADEAEARLVAERQNLEIAAEHRTPLYTVESVTKLHTPRRSFVARVLRR